MIRCIDQRFVFKKIKINKNSKRSCMALKFSLSNLQGLGANVTEEVGYCFSFNCLKYLQTMAHSEGFSNLMIPQIVSLLSQYAKPFWCDLIQSFLHFSLLEVCWFHWLFRNRGKARFRFLLSPGRPHWRVGVCLRPLPSADAAGTTAVAVAAAAVLLT